MATNGNCRQFLSLFLIPIFTALVLVSSDAWRSPALADGPGSITKGPEVSTVGTGPYHGPLPEELAKLAAVEAAGVTSPLPAKTPETVTITKGGPIAPTAAELAKLAALPTNPDTLAVPVMPKLGLMQVPRDGTPELTAQEREKRARELAAPHVITLNSPTGQVRSGDSPSRTDSTSVRIQRQTEALKENGTPAARQPAQRSTR
jgi:hypothetical protein